eukprot:CAMPEP_0203678298 /NCGR_PEP_ID=MMETSP0090-20130426/31427_1 /ASSEMBLY_ACC=CAM_ASM_001088 /TAXON_ID=426623 /ORGANISM="Chaetoceros affinis, Strain CCMP159" /LENGTH=62 /DNA_ID=CAMNT_0050545479 /DNA_START=99 /DNA_END=287 /DNA_ORIENTATION=+
MDNPSADTDDAIAMPDSPIFDDDDGVGVDDTVTLPMVEHLQALDSGLPDGGGVTDADVAVSS